MLYQGPKQKHPILPGACEMEEKELEASHSWELTDQTGII